MSNPRVYVVQEVLTYKSGMAQPQYDLRPAALYGELEILLPCSRLPLATHSTIATLERKLRDFSDNDYLLPVGDPIAIAMAASVAAKMNHGKVQMLKWDRDNRAYIKVAFDLYFKRQAA